MNNYEFSAQWVLDQNHEENVKVLDYGCGSGQIVAELRKRNVDGFGCDVFYEGGNYLETIPPDFLENAIVKKMDGNIIPFESDSFDYVINNQVLEHVENLDSVLAEINRVLKPGGAVLCLFPDKGVWREGHCGIPFLHWFPKGSTFRVYYAAILRTLGLGYHKKGKSRMRWSRDFCDWLDQWTYYRSRQEIDLSFNKYFSNIVHTEDYWFQKRLGRKKVLIVWLPKPIQSFIVRKLGGLIFVAEKRSDEVSL